MKSGRAALLIFLALGVLLVPLAAETQQAPGKVPRIGILTVARTGDAQVENNFEALRQGLRERGWIDGQNIAFEYRWADGRYERLPDLAADLVRLNVKAIVGATTPLIQAVKNTTETIPVVMVAILDPVGARFVASLARPGGNITGLTFLPGPGLVGKQLELLKQTIPAASRIALVTNPSNQAHAPLVREVEAAARTLQVSIQTFGATNRDDLDKVFAAMAHERVGAVLVLADAAFYTLRERIGELLARNGLPAMSGFRELAVAGSLLVSCLQRFFTMHCSAFAPIDGAYSTPSVMAHCQGTSETGH